MDEKKGEKERIIRLETIINQHEKRIEKIEETIDNLNNHITDLREKMASVITRMDEMEKNIERNTRRSMWFIGILITIINIILNIILYVGGG